MLCKNSEIYLFLAAIHRGSSAHWERLEGKRQENQDSHALATDLRVDELLYDLNQLHASTTSDGSVLARHVRSLIEIQGYTENSDASRARAEWDKSSANTMSREELVSAGLTRERELQSVYAGLQRSHSLVGSVVPQPASRSTYSGTATAGSSSATSAPRSKSSAPQQKSYASKAARSFRRLVDRK